MTHTMDGRLSTVSSKVLALLAASPPVRVLFLEEGTFYAELADATTVWTSRRPRSVWRVSWMKPGDSDDAQ